METPQPTAAVVVVVMIAEAIIAVMMEETAMGRVHVRQEVM